MRRNFALLGVVLIVPAAIAAVTLRLLGFRDYEIASLVPLFALGGILVFQVVPWLIHVIVWFAGWVRRKMHIGEQPIEEPQTIEKP